MKLQRESTLRIAKDDGAGHWVNLGGIGNPAGQFITSTNPFTTFSDFALASESLEENPLPIELLHFDAEIVNNSIRTFWETATEQNNDYFAVERSTELLENQFEEIGRIRGLNIENSQYEFFDVTPVNGQSYYRLKQVDFDGSVTLSKVVSVAYDPGSIKLYPNPFEENLIINLDGKWDDRIIELMILDSSGGMLNHELLALEKGGHQIVVDGRLLPPGLYFIRLRGNESGLSEVMRAVKAK